MTIDQKLKELRIKWKNEPENRATIEKQVKVLKIGQNFPDRHIYVEDMASDEIMECLDPK